MRLIDADKITFFNCLANLGNGSVCCHTEGITSKLGIEMQPTVEAIPIEWIVDWLTKQHIPATHTCDDYYAVEMMLDDWEKENER